MANCAEKRPYHQQQTLFKFGGTHGSVNCTACSAAMVAEATMCGPKHAIRGSEVRAASNEPTPDPDFPGLTLRQVRDALLKITDDRVVLTIKENGKFEHFKSRLLRGEVAVLQVQRRVFKEQGFGFGKAFAGLHAVAVGFDHRKLWVDDPLSHKFLPTWSQVAEAAAALELGGGDTVGQGRAWAAFASRATKLVATQRITIAPGPLLVHTLQNGFIFSKAVRQVTVPLDVDCTAETTFVTHPFGPRGARPARDLLIMMSGPFKGFGIKPTASTVSISSVRDDDPDSIPPPQPDPLPSRIDLTSPVLPDRGDGFEPGDDAELERLDNEGVEEDSFPGLRNEDVGEPMEPLDAVEEEEPPELLGEG
jgi:hypothetical protein